jgi:hypothetical protein
MIIIIVIEFSSFLVSIGYLPIKRDGAVVNVLRYKSEGRWFDSRLSHLNFSSTYSFQDYLSP